ncbi:hypothetical protein NDU88_005225 [Pleurodeles waltl]|uniref:Uncharacterized protein n=1 Tax=Pleurodeles waltl TaxID=8319 RepID=A0AAV7WXA1_PLEWA|nr:hypothetical protein NDU88_005225 [Pleurodeles waltl]
MSGVHDLDVIQTPTNPAASLVEGGDFKSLSGRNGERGQRAAAAPAGKANQEAVQERSVADTAATNNVPYQTAQTEKTPGPGGGM